MLDTTQYCSSQELILIRWRPINPQKSIAHLRLQSSKAPEAWCLPACCLLFHPDRKTGKQITDTQHLLHQNGVIPSTQWHRSVRFEAKILFYGIHEKKLEIEFAKEAIESSFDDRILEKKPARYLIHTLALLCWWLQRPWPTILSLLRSPYYFR